MYYCKDDVKCKIQCALCKERERGFKKEIKIVATIISLIAIVIIIILLVR